LQRFGKIEIKDNCYIGVNCIILPNVTIGPNSIVGAGSVVTKNIPPGTIAAGNPAKVIKQIEEYKSAIIKEWEIQRPENYVLEFKKYNEYSADIIEKIKYKNRFLLIKNFKNIFNNHCVANKK